MQSKGVGKSGYIAIPIAIANTVVWEMFAVKKFSSAAY